MLKKLIIGSAILVTTSGAAFANAAPYVGAGLGVLANTTNSANSGSYRGVPFNVFAGYGGVLTESFYLAGELTGTLTTGVIADNGMIKSTYSYGASILPGVMLSDHTLAFLRAGVVRTRFSEISTSQTGGQFGFGMQTSLTQSVDLRGEYDFTAYRSVNAKFAGTRYSAKPRQDAFNLSLVYKFD